MNLHDFQGLLTKKEQEVFYILLSGYTTEQIANDLEISPRAVRFHIQQIYKKSGFKTRLQLQSHFLDRNIPMMIFEMKKEIAELRAAVQNYLPMGKSNVV